jgi:hypothetical protein
LPVFFQYFFSSWCQWQNSFFNWIQLYLNVIIYLAIILFMYWIWVSVHQLRWEKCNYGEKKQLSCLQSVRVIEIWPQVSAPTLLPMLWLNSKALKGREGLQELLWSWGRLSPQLSVEKPVICWFQATFMGPNVIAKMSLKLLLSIWCPVPGQDLAI